MKILIFVFSFLLLMNTRSSAQQKNIERVAKAAEALRMAMINADSIALDDLTADSLTYGHSGGHIENKPEFIQKIVSGRSDFVSIDITDQSIRIVNGTAFIRHILSAVTDDGGKPGTVKLSVLQVWIKAKGKWKLAARQAVKPQ